MTDDLISRADAINKIENASREWGEEYGISDVLCDLDDMPSAQTVDALPVRPGKWIPCAKSGLILTEQMRKEGIRWYGFKCSVCGFIRKGNAPREANYCEYCGSYMRGDDNVE